MFNSPVFIKLKFGWEGFEHKDTNVHQLQNGINGPPGIHPLDDW